MPNPPLTILHGLDGLRQLPKGAALTIGNFDGLHRGHQLILELVRSCPGAAASAVVTFEPHPLTVLRPEAAPPRLTPPKMKQQLLSDAGMNYEVILPPAKEVLDLTAEAFWAILRDEVRPSHLVEGSRFNFGKNRGGNIDTLIRWANTDGIPLSLAKSVEVQLMDQIVVPVSSSLIRWLIANGRMRDAANCLGRPYTLEGEVVKGFQRGRTIGVPTANLTCADQLIPCDGVYAGRSRIDGQTFAAAVSIGTMPTFGANTRQIEAHLIAFDGDLYGRTIQLELLDWLRDQQRFPGVDALKAQLNRDIDRAAVAV